jgi:hypothetical protein
MEKKQYEKPVVLDLNGSRVCGGPLGCYTGNSANGFLEVCYTGNSPTYIVAPCQPGSNPGDGDCISGASTNYYCEGGMNGNRDPDGCRNGPSVTP